MGCSTMMCLEMFSISACSAAWLSHSTGQESPAPPSSLCWETISILAANSGHLWQHSWDVQAGGSTMHPQSNLPSVLPGPNAQRAREAACTLSPVQGVSLAFAVPGAEEQDEVKERVEPWVPSAPLHHSTDMVMGARGLGTTPRAVASPGSGEGAHHHCPVPAV